MISVSTIRAGVVVAVVPVRGDATHLILCAGAAATSGRTASLGGLRRGREMLHVMVMVAEPMQVVIMAIGLRPVERVHLLRARMEAGQPLGLDHAARGLAAVGAQAAGAAGGGSGGCCGGGCVRMTEIGGVAAAAGIVARSATVRLLLEQLERVCHLTRAARK